MKKKCTIELFSGLESFSNVARGALIGHSDFFTIDNDPFFNATFQEDILAFKYKEKIPPSEYMVTHLWASPPCTEYSRARTTGPPRDFVRADSLVLKAREIIDYYTQHSNPGLIFYIENPANGYLKTRRIMQDLNEKNQSHFVNYCAYQPDWGLRKGTLVWSNQKGFVGRKCPGARHCLGAMPSPYVVNRFVHRHTPRGKYWHSSEWKSPQEKKRKLGRVPPLLIKALLCVHGEEPD